MRLFTKNRIMKGYTVEFSQPRLVEYAADRFENLAGHLKVVTGSTQDLSQAARRDVPSGQGSAVAAVAWIAPSAAAGGADEAGAQAGLLGQDAAAEAAQALAAARTQAAAILADAEAQAADLLREAQAELARQREELTRAVWAEVMEQARAAGYQEGLAAAEAEAARLKSETQRLWQLAQRAVNEELAKNGEQLLHLALKIAERLVRADLAVRPQHLLQIIRQLALLPQERSGWLLHVSAADADFIQGLKPEDQLPCPWVADDTLQQGDCFLECQEGLFDARLEAELGKLEQILKEEMAHAGLAAASPASDGN